jgi:hypothetical protein
MEVFFTKRGVLKLGIMGGVAVGIILGVLVSHGVMKQRGKEE